MLSCVKVSELLVSANAEPGVQSKMEELVRHKNDILAELHAELQRIRDAHMQMTKAYESKLAIYGIPVEELGFIPAN